MPKITIEYSLPEETEEFNLSNKAEDYYTALLKIQDGVMRWRNYGQSSCVKIKDIEDVVYGAIGDLLDEDI